MDFVESFWVLYLNKSNHPIGVYQISQGGLAGTYVDPKLVFMGALACSAAALIIAHNHPSSNLTPSDNDIQMTKKIKQCGVVLELPVLDHIIMTSNGYFSFSDQGLL